MTESKRDDKGRFVLGGPGGPGRPKDSVSLVTVIKRKIREDPARADRIVENLMALAEDGDHRALKSIQTLLDRVDGKVIQKVEVRDDVVRKVVVLEREEGSEDGEDGGELDDSGTE